MGGLREGSPVSTANHAAAGPAARPARLKPVAVAVGVAGAAALVAVNFAAAMLTGDRPWLLALAVALDVAVVGAGLAYILRRRAHAEARTARVRAALEASRAQLAAIVDSAMDAIITVDQEQRIVLFNRAAETLFRCRRDEALGAKLDQFIPARFRDGHRTHIERFGETGETRRRMGSDLVLRALRADGTEFPIEASISRTGHADQRVFTVILRDITQRKQVEDEVERQQAELRELSARMLEAREEEKTLIARELHDELGQLLTALKMDLAWLRERIPDGQVSGRARQMGMALDQTVAAVRRIAANLRPLMLDDLGLADAARWLVEDFAQRSGIPCSLDEPDDVPLDGVERSVATAVYRALQESLTNIARHAGAKHAWVLLAADNAAVRLEVEDDGRGIPPEALASTRSLGLRGMRERVQYLGGTLEVAQGPRGGTRVRVRVPLRPAARETTT
jgi:PAS domain S-box-containing protein